jgi:cytochrome c biogenesis protein CcdA
MLRGGRKSRLQIAPAKGRIFMQELLVTIKSMINGSGYGPVSVVFSFVLGTLSAIASACCTLPLMGAVAGFSVSQNDNRQKALRSAVLFLLGAIAALMAIGCIVIFFGQSAIRVSGGYWKIAAGCIALVFGIGSLRLFPFTLPKMAMKNPAASCGASSIPMEEDNCSRLPTPKQALGKAQTLGFTKSVNKLGGVGSGLSGAIFGGTIVVTSLPCNPGIFVILGAAVLERHTLWALTNLFVYALGFGAPLSALVFGLSFGKSVLRMQKAEKIVRTAAGILLIVSAMYLFYTF